MKRVKYVSLIFLLTLILVGCKSLSPAKENVKKENNVASTQSTKISNKKYSASLMKETSRLELVTIYDTKSDLISIPKPNTQYSSRPNHTVAVFKLTGNTHFGYGNEGLIAKNGEDRVLFDLNQYQGSDSALYYVLTFPETVPLEKISNYKYVATVLDPDSNSLELELSLITDIESKEGVVQGDIFNISDKDKALWLPGQQVLIEGGDDRGANYKLSFDLLTFGSSLNIGKNDISIYIVNGDEKEKVNSSDITFLNGDKKCDIINMTGKYSIEFNRIFTFNQLNSEKYSVELHINKAIFKIPVKPL